MKTTTPKLLLIISILFFLNCQHLVEKQELEYPNDWFFRQRAYPTGKIDYSKYLTESQSIILLKKQRASLRGEETDWESAGPSNVGGRVTDIEMHPSDQEVIYVGAASGGIFKSNNKGETWEAIFDDALSLSIGDIAIAASDPKIIYVGTGEANAGGGSLAYDGVGLYKSIDAGQTWEWIGPTKIGSIGKVVIHPTDPNIVYVAAMGRLFGDNEERGIYKTIDGGKNWEKILYINPTTGGIDLAIDSQNPERVYAAMWDRVRRPKFRKYYGTGSGIYKTENAGTDWTKLSNGLPNGELGRIGIALAPSDPEKIYSVISNSTGRYEGMYISTDFGETWSKKSLDQIANVPYMWWFGKLLVHPNDSDKVYTIGFNMDASQNGGDSWNRIFNNVHVDQHALYIHPSNPDFMIAGNDGGIYISENGGATYQFKKTLAITQFYTCEIDQQNPDRFYGGTQDNGTHRTFGSNDGWQKIGGGDGFYVLVDPTDNNYIYTESQYGNLRRSINKGNSFQSALTGIPNARNNWNTPIIFDAQNPQTLYYCNEKVYKSTDRAKTWSAISPDLSNGSGGGNLTFGTITTIASSILDNKILYVGTDDGNVWNTLDGGANWTKLSEELPMRWVTRVAADPFNQAGALVTFSGYRYNEDDGYIFITNDNGSTWVDITGNLPDVPVNDIIYDPQKEDWFYVASDLGVFYTTDGGINWELLGVKLPNVPVTDLVFHKATRQLVAATYGRSMYTYDLSEFTATHDPYLSTLELAVFPNPFIEKLTISFELEEAQKVELKIYDLQGKEVMVLNKGVLAVGNQEFNWRPRNISKGIYIIIVVGENFRAVKKVEYY